jgi:N-acetylmuramoyl-L-alanine amidase
MSRPRKRRTEAASSPRAIGVRLFRFLLLLAFFLTSGFPALPAYAAQPLPTVDDANWIDLREAAREMGASLLWQTPEKELLLAGHNARIEFTAGSRQVRVNGVRVFMGEPALFHRRQLHVSRVDYERTLRPLLRPHVRPPARAIRTIVLDPGHGGRDSGTRNAQLNLQEKDLTLQVATRLKVVLEQQGYRVFLTRSDDTFVGLEERSAMANSVGADLFISIHFNAVDNPAVHGTETYILTPRTHRSTGQGAAAASDAVGHRGNEHDQRNMLLGYLVQWQLLRDLKTFDRGLKRARFQVLRGIDCPAVLVEAGYLSHRDEAMRIATAEYQNNLVRSLAIAINRYRQATENIAAAGN